MAPQSATADGRLFFLKIDRLAVILRPILDPLGGIIGSVLGTNPLGGKIVSVNPDGTDRQIVLGGLNSIPDGIQVDVKGGHIYWTNMGRPDLNDGWIQRVDLDGGNITTIVPEGATFTPKQLKLDRRNGKLYWSDREGMRVMRANLDGSNIETLVETGRGDADRQNEMNWCVGIAVDVDRGHIYWTQKGSSDANEGRIFRANLELPKGESPAHRTDIEELFRDLPEPIDLDLDLANRTIYWSDRGDTKGGNSISRASMDADPQGQRTREILLRDLHEGIGLSLDVERDRMFFTDLGGTVYRARLDGSERKELLSGQGNLTGIAYVAPFGG
ncbi:3-hydroxyacyl-CoA dehydrogenase [Methyloceanibacter sp.]|uniref:3-hydroxyacyl-CoA dehydrogenase n=1 Tax=Methyloceanibacter sp. TaxID=1965321 RepID=UPI003D6D2936